mmetsp:Transcript_28689/g.35161  ORF Transcript_28689/g.35161 Transcript_28689/m.35161 type:complete len:89 (+) Transcript_28689:233-499(+)
MNSLEGVTNFGGVRTAAGATAGAGATTGAMGATGATGAGRRSGSLSLVCKICMFSRGGATSATSLALASTIHDGTQPGGQLWLDRFLA